MAVLNKIAKVVAKPIPRMITPKGHAVIDYANVGLFLGTTAWFWRRNQRAAMASLICGSAELAVSPQHALNVMRILELARESSHRRCTIPWSVSEARSASES